MAILIVPRPAGPQAARAELQSRAAMIAAARILERAIPDLPDRLVGQVARLSHTGTTPDEIITHALAFVKRTKIVFSSSRFATS